MARPLRLEYPGAFYHVIQRGIERKNIFLHDKDKGKFLSYLDASYRAYKALFHTYILMDNHYHLILETPQGNLSKIMHYLNTSYAAYYNSRHKRVGPLYQGRFKAMLVQEDEYLHYLSCYIHLNPVRARLTKFPETYRYSSYNYFVSKEKPPEWLNTALILSMFDKNTSKAKKLYGQFVMDNIGKEKEIINKDTKRGLVLGDDDFFQTIKNKLIAREEYPEIPILKELKHGIELALEDIKIMVEKHIKDDRRLTRTVSIYLSRKYTQKTLNEIAAFYGKIQYTGVSQIYRRMERRRAENAELNKLIAKLESEMIKCQM